MGNDRSSLYPNFSDPIDRVCEEFERAWASGGFTSISAALEPVSESRRTNALIELIQIDLERRWRSIQRTRPNDPLPRRPIVEDYQCVFPGIGEIPLVVIGQEFRVRWQWGDRPSPDETALRFPERREAVLAACHTVLLSLGEAEHRTLSRDAGQDAPFAGDDDSGCSDWPDPPA